VWGKHGGSKNSYGTEFLPAGHLCVLTKLTNELLWSMPLLSGGGRMHGAEADYRQVMEYSRLEELMTRNVWGLATEEAQKSQIQRSNSRGSSDQPLETRYNSV